MAEEGASGTSKPRAGTVVLVPGGFMGPWIWQDVESQLRGAGAQVMAVTLASVADADAPASGGFAEDVSAVRAALEAAEPPVVLCGHSYGGAVITEAASGPHPSVARLVYLAGAAPDAGESLADLGPTAVSAVSDDRTETSSSADEAEQVRVRSDGSIELVVEAAIAGLFNDCDVERANEAAALLRPMNAAVNQQPVTAVPWRDVSTTYVRCADDQVPELLSAEFLDHVDDVVELPTGHCPQWSRPDLVAGLLLDRVPERR
jgi:pimeloyl-ACP methyl ester carboxylesterase